MFANRTDAANQLAAALIHHRNMNSLVLAIPRGAVPMSKVIADKLAGELDVVLVHKVGHPENPEFAIGAIDEDGNFYSQQDHFAINETELAALKNKQVSHLRKKRKLYTPNRTSISAKDRDIIIVDDGVATGSTMVAAIHMLRRAGAQHIAVAFPVGPKSSVQALKEIANEVVCLQTPPYFESVGQYYADFSQVSDEEVIRVLKA